MSAEEIRRRLEYFQDLGIKHIYRRKDAPSAPAQTIKPHPIPAREPVPKPPESIVNISLPGLAPAGDTLARILEDIGDCTRCRLHKGRNKLVFGTGSPEAKLVFVGEGPGADEDE